MCHNFCKDQALVLNWECLHWDESIVSLQSLVVSVCSLLKSRKFCLKNCNKQNPLILQSLWRGAPLSRSEDGTDIPPKPARGLWRCQKEQVAHCHRLSEEAVPILRLPELLPLVKYLPSSQGKTELKKDGLYTGAWQAQSGYREKAQKITR